MRACAQCDKTTKNAKFCSRSCSASYNNALFPKKKRVPTFCKDCGTATSWKRAIRCIPCNNARQRTAESRTIADVQGAAMYQISARIRSHARAVLSRSGRAKVCAVCGYSVHVEVSHRKAISEFPLTTRLDEVNHPDNLDYLCRNHHWEFEKGLLTL